jgi:hypothetical protein
MENETSQSAASSQCWSCKGEVGQADRFCRQCGMNLIYGASGAVAKGQQQFASPNEQIHARLVSIEKLMIKTIAGVGALLLLVGWIALQLHHFGRE